MPTQSLLVGGGNMYNAVMAVSLIFSVAHPVTGNGAVAAKALKAEYAIAQQYGDKDPRGADPNGPDVHDEVHDKALPANKAEEDRQAPTDVYGGQAGKNTQAPDHGL
jgi:hypothetical protein